MSTSLRMPYFEIIDTPLAGVKKIVRKVRDDSRGSFERIFCSEELVAAGWGESIAQVNRSLTAYRGTVRGLHFQLPPHAEMKLVSCIRGEVWDVVVDLRRGSPTFMHWHAESLSPHNAVALLIPKGVAHGFQSLCDQSELLYCHSAAYAPTAEGGVRFDDPAIGIPWPLPPCNQSQRDLAHPLIAPDFTGFSLSS
jgi:dTDP-4-dehydrorhamnose 3,5-epimerase